ncbi:hypothetical protein FQN60_018395 [Etheostoma spectabile]|uniref:Uncharacterized protein n=1 Tax=Etheostoma spectabile TaxID=54343 RepID=A0A5J5DI81_9PERO|nr:hypothetical protein FQN60_018395 [Etheostoma spectabile]
MEKIDERGEKENMTPVLAFPLSGVLMKRKSRSLGVGVNRHIEECSLFALCHLHAVSQIERRHRHIIKAKTVLMAAGGFDIPTPSLKQAKERVSYTVVHKNDCIWFGRLQEHFKIRQLAKEQSQGLMLWPLWCTPISQSVRRSRVDTSLSASPNPEANRWYSWLPAQQAGCPVTGHDPNLKNPSSGPLWRVQAGASSLWASTLFLISLVSESRGGAQSLTVEGIGGVIGRGGGEGCHRETWRSGQVGFAVGVVASQAQARSWAGFLGCSGGAGGDGRRLSMKPMKGASDGHPVTGVRLVVVEHETVGVEGVGHRRWGAGRQGAGVQGMEVVGGVNQWETRLKAGGIVDAGGAVAASQVGCIGVSQTVRVPT